MQVIHRSKINVYRIDAHTFTWGFTVTFENGTKRSIAGQAESEHAALRAAGIATDRLVDKGCQ